MGYNLVGSLSSATITSSGTAQANATPLTATVNIINHVPVGTAVIIDPTPNKMQIVANKDGSNTLIAFPPVGSSIENLPINTAYQIGINRTVGFATTPNNTIYVIFGGLSAVF